MKVLYLHQYFNTPEMAGGTRSYEMARRLVEAGHEVHMITTDRTPSGRRGWYTTVEAGIEVHWLPVPYDNRMSYRQRLAAFSAFALQAGPRAARVGGDVVFATSTPLTIALPAVYASKRLGLPMVFEVRDLWPEVPIAMGALRGPVATGAARWLERFAYRNAARIVALSPGMAAGVVRAGYPAERVQVIPNGADLDVFRPDEAAARAFRASYPWLQDRPLVLYPGSLGRINGVDYLARLAAAVRDEAPEVRFLVIGAGIEQEKVVATARDLGVLDVNFFMFGRLPKRSMPAAFAAATVTTSLVIDLEATWANSANKFFDGLASGTPVAINHGGWQAELLEEADAGLVLPREIGAARARLLEALRSPEWLRRAGRNARRLAEERFSRERLAGQFETTLRLAWEERGAAPVAVPPVAAGGRNESP